ncbi:MAG: hypothetical protein CMJ77_23295 [Planctomycetaceae bacterium]|nr:hypothetical protein [Planctomycetaceae bacterium]
MRSRRVDAVGDFVVACNCWRHERIEHSAFAGYSEQFAGYSEQPSLTSFSSRATYPSPETLSKFAELTKPSEGDA